MVSCSHTSQSTWAAAAVQGTGEAVAIKKFLETEADPQIRKIAVREVKMLKVIALQGCRQPILYYTMAPSLAVARTRAAVEPRWDLST